MRKTFYADVRRLSEKKSCETEIYQSSYRPFHALSFLDKDIFTFFIHFLQMDGTIVRKNMLKQRSVIGTICEAIKNTGSRISVKELRALSVQHGPSKKCTNTSINIFAPRTVLFCDVVWIFSDILHRTKLFSPAPRPLILMTHVHILFLRSFFEFIFGWNRLFLFRAHMKHLVFVCCVHRATEWDVV
jgi:hypothetical protein